ncbi:MAG: DUF542 domain-containing protein [Armatimonadetes bacterium]|nr:DUF542 domain-containing protein [Armatimonadota bacterium]MDE2206149.1 DUF542 domain-containing protein [Armatimonadota bacterium]
MSVIEPTISVAKLVAERQSRAMVFERFGLDYCCQGGLPLDEACHRAGIDLFEMIGELAASDARTPAPDDTDWNRASINELVDHIVSVHHAYLVHALPDLAAVIDKVDQEHGRQRPELAEIRKVFSDLHVELETHMAKEEHVLFPYCRRLESEFGTPRLHGRSIAQPVRIMEDDHLRVNIALDRLSELTDGFASPHTSSAVWDHMLMLLLALEVDLHLHISEENNLLFPRALELESKLAEPVGAAFRS